jgi:hypothetical protein
MIKKNPETTANFFIAQFIFIDELANISKKDLLA